MTSTATLPVTIVAKAAEAAIESIEAERRQLERDRLDGRNHHTRAHIEFIGSERQARCAALLTLCSVTRKAHCTTVTVSAEDAAAIDEFIA
jgi:hypothetical protein